MVLSTPSGLLSGSKLISQSHTITSGSSHSAPQRRVNTTADLLKAVIASTDVLGESVVQGVLGFALEAAKEVRLSVLLVVYCGQC